MLLKYLDTNGDGSIDFIEFLEAIRGRMSDRRMALVERAFSKYDPKNTGFIDIENLKGEYNCDMNTRVLSGEITPLMAFQEFLLFFDQKFDKPGFISREEWLDYFSAVSCSISCDQHFEDLMNSTWRLEPVSMEAVKEFQESWISSI